MCDLKSKIAETVYAPDFIKDYETDDKTKTEIIELLYDILDTYYKGVNDFFYQNKIIASLCRKIDRFSHRLSEITPPDLFLNIWLWIGRVIEQWITYSINYENYESAQNLQKILDCDYV